MLDHYEILEVIGRGGMGIVLRGLDARLNRVVAIKALAPELAANVLARKRFQREAQASAAISHDHVGAIHAVDECNKLPYLVMECIDGKSLQQIIDEEGSLDVKRILRIGMQIASGLGAAHDQGLVHRDVKPANILLENGIERVKITDFGLARAIDDVSVTRTGETPGTPQYMSPEQAEGKAVDHRSDLFSLGSVLYAMCTGRPAFRGESSMAVLRRVCDDTPRPIREVNPDIPTWLVEIVDKLLAKNPEARFQSAAEVSQVLGRRLAEIQQRWQAARPQPAAVPIETSRQVRSHRGPGRLRPRRPGLLVAAMLMMGCLTLALLEATGVTNARRFMGLTSHGTAPRTEKGSVGPWVRRSVGALRPLDPQTHRPLDPQTLRPTDPRPVKVFIMAGDSNMGGRAAESLLKFQASQPQTRRLFEHLFDGDQWVVREDVWIKNLDREGNLSVGSTLRDWSIWREGRPRPRFKAIQTRPG